MKNTPNYAGILRWYPPKWRERYGEGLVALLEDTHGGTAVPRREQRALRQAGLGERLRDSGLIGDSATRGEKLKAGSQLVLASLAPIVVAGAVFSKSSEHSRALTPMAHRTITGLASASVLWAAVASLVVLLVASALAAPACYRLFRTKEYVPRGLLAVTASTFALTAALTFGLSLWAHRLSPAQRNGGSLLYEFAFLLLALAVVALVAAGTTTVLAVTRRVTFTPGTLQILGVLALALTFFMVVIVAGVALWWTNEALYAPSVLREGIGNGVVFSSAALPPSLLGAGILLLLGLSGAAAGSRRVIQGLRSSAP